MEIPQPWLTSESALAFLQKDAHVNEVWEFVFDHINKKESMLSGSTVIILPSGDQIWLDDDPVWYMLRSRDGQDAVVKRIYCRVTGPGEGLVGALYLETPEQLFAWVAQLHFGDIGVHAGNLDLNPDYRPAERGAKGD